MLRANGKSFPVRSIKYHITVNDAVHKFFLCDRQWASFIKASSWAPGVITWCQCHAVLSILLPSAHYILCTIWLITITNMKTHKVAFILSFITQKPLKENHFTHLSCICVDDESRVCVTRSDRHAAFTDTHGKPWLFSCESGLGLGAQTA